MGAAPLLSSTVNLPHIVNWSVQGYLAHKKQPPPTRTNMNENGRFRFAAKLNDFFVTFAFIYFLFGLYLIFFLDLRAPARDGPATFENGPGPLSGPGLLSAVHLSRHKWPGHAISGRRLVDHPQVSSTVFQKPERRNKKLFAPPLPHSGLRRERFRGGLVFKAHRLLYHSTLGLRVIKKKKKKKGFLVGF